MAKKKNTKKTPLKDFDIVAHTISVPPQRLKGPNYKNYELHAIYINRYGLEVGYLVFDTEGKEYHSWDHLILQEYWELKDR